MRWSRGDSNTVTKNNAVTENDPTRSIRSPQWFILAAHVALTVLFGFPFLMGGFALYAHEANNHQWESDIWLEGFVFCFIGLFVVIAGWAHAFRSATWLAGTGMRSWLASLATTVLVCVLAFYGHEIPDSLFGALPVSRLYRYAPVGELVTITVIVVGFSVGVLSFATVRRVRRVSWTIAVLFVVFGILEMVV